MRRWLVTAVTIISVLAALPASASPAIPWISDMLVERPWTPLVTLCLVVICGFIQAVIIRRFCTKKSLLRWTLELSAATLLFSKVIGHNSSPWLDLGFCFVCATLLYSVLLPILKVGELRRWWSYLGLSALVNAASYGFTGLLVFALLDAPTMLHNDRVLLRQVKGYFIISRISFGNPGLLSMPSNHLYHIENDITPDEMYSERPVSVGAVIDPTTNEPYYTMMTTNSEASMPINLPKSITKTLAVSHDGRFLYCNMGKDTAFYSLAKNRIIQHARGSIGNLADGAFSSDNRYFAGTDTRDQICLVDINTGKAKKLGEGRFVCFNKECTQLSWIAVDGPLRYSTDYRPTYGYQGKIITYNLKSAARTSIRIPGGYVSSLAISPEGGVFAYIGFEPNRFARRLMIPALIVVSADGSRSAMVHRLDERCGDLSILWLPPSTGR